MASANSETDICNLALGYLGEARITSLEENSVSARACSLHYDNTRDEVLRSHRWNFAQTRKVLSQSTDRPVFGWKYQYELPADCLRVLEFNGSEMGDILSSPFIVEGRKILTGDNEARLVYLKRIETVSEFDPLFVQAFAVKLAVVLSETIRGTTSKTEQLTSLYERVTAPLARRVDANEGRRRKGLLPINSHALRERGLGVGSLGSSYSDSGGLGIPTDTETDEEETEMDTWTVPLIFHGEAVDLQTFGGYQPNAAVKLTAIEITAQVAPIGGTGIRIQLVDNLGANISTAVVLPSGSSQVRSILTTPLTIADDTIIRAKFTSVGSSVAGDGVNVLLSFENVSA